MNRIKKLFLSLTLLMSILGGTTLYSPVYAQSTTDSAKQQVCTGVNGQAGGTCGTGGVDLSVVIKAVLNILSVVAGVAAVVMVIIAGLRYITSSGDAQAVGGAKKTLIYAIVGLVVVALAQVIVHFVLSNT